jgi:hypothetical protein
MMKGIRSVQVMRERRVFLAVLALGLALPGLALANLVEDAVRAGAQGMVDYVTMRINTMVQVTVPTSFADLMGGPSGESGVYLHALELYGAGITKSVAYSLMALVMLVRLVRVSERVDTNQTMPAVREVILLFVSVTIYAHLIAHAWDLMAGLFHDLSAIWSAWSAAPPVRVDAIDVSPLVGLSALLPIFVCSSIAMVLADVSVVVAKVVVWGRGMQLYFMATMAPIPLALLGLEETRAFGVGFLRNFASLVLGYAALSFVLGCYPTLLALAINESAVAGGVSDMVLAVTAGCALQVNLVVRCGAWARDVLGG